MTEWIPPVLLVGGFAVFCVLSCASLSGQQRSCDEMNAAEDAYAEAWRYLTEADREWVIANGGTEPSLIRWELR